MNFNLLLLLVCFCFVQKTVLSLQCLSNACELAKANNECKPVPPRCPKGYVLRRGGICLCCDMCKKVLYEGGNCTAESPIAGRTSDKVVCADGLQCIGGVCKKWNPGQNC
ncbi:fungal protease inhibitor-1-like isoform X1 [Harmonia axyridis]|uniref:fungal protease inhibitor-1-like isoform X1 n=1 Tax=Harmonia axyridis TaxID=115357 RepID=UPI001E277FD8|nr:fungal protease inhibitor-1-like isoform X1 [Harmonia axyridis]